VLLLGPAAVPAAQADGGLSCRYQLSTWGGGFSADLTVRNSGPAIDGWTIAWTAPPATVNQAVWNASVAPSPPSVLAFSNAFWNGRVPTGGATSFGWTARALSATVPDDITVNGTPCPVTG
jgi:hypothetical protein